MSAWQPIETAPLCGNDVLVWIEDIDEPSEGWIKVGVIARTKPHCIVDEDGREYWPHENGGVPTHWMAFPEAPHTASPSSPKTLQGSR